MTSIIQKNKISVLIQIKNLKLCFSELSTTSSDKNHYNTKIIWLFKDSTIQVSIKVGFSSSMYQFLNPTLEGDKRIRSYTQPKKINSQSIY